MQALRDYLITWGSYALVMLIPLIITVVFMVICILTLVRLCKVLGKVQGFFEEIESNGLTLAQIEYAKAMSIKTIAETSDDIADEIEGIKVATEAIGYEDMDIYERYKKGRD